MFATCNGEACRACSERRLSLGRAPKIITVECSDPDDTLEDLLNYIKVNGNTGHTFSIIVDPGDERERKFDWDGDGADSIRNVEVA